MPQVSLQSHNRPFGALAVVLCAMLFFEKPSVSASPGAAQFTKEIQPILSEYCFDCHGDGMKKGKVAFDEFKTPDEALQKTELWAAVLKNLRAGIMPPEKKPHPSKEEIDKISAWIKQQAFGIDPANPDPG